MAGSLRRSERWWKQAWHRLFRRTTKAKLKQGLEPPLHPEDVGADIWDGPKDGKIWLGAPVDAPDRDRVMRK